MVQLKYGEVVDYNLSFSESNHEKINDAYSILGITERSRPTVKNRLILDVDVVFGYNSDIMGTGGLSVCA